MPDRRDTELIEGARTQRMRLGAALLYGRVGERRTVNDNVKRIVASVIVAALICGGCAGVSFVTQLLANQAAAASAPMTTSQTTPEVP